MDGKKIVAFLCENSGWKAYLNAAGDARFDCIEAVRLPCSGKVEVGLILKLLERGNPGVLVIGCPKDNCKYLEGNRRSEKRVAVARAALRDAGIEENRVRMDFISSVDSHRLLSIVEEYRNSLGVPVHEKGKV